MQSEFTFHSGGSAATSQGIRWCFTTFVLHSLVLAVAGSLVASASLVAQAQGTIDCSPGGHGANCEVKLGTGQTSTLVRFRPTEPLVTPDGPQRFYVQGGGIRVTQVPLAGDKTAQIHWSQLTPPTDTSFIFVQTAGVPVVQVDTIRIIPAAAAMRKVSAQEDLAPYVWIRNAWIPLTLRIGVSPADGAPLTREECEGIRFSLQSIPDGDASPDTGRASYDDGGRRFNCVVEGRWKFADVTGRQHLGLRVGDHFVRVPGVAREGPRVVAGIARFARHASNDTRYCVGYDQAFDDCSPDRQSFADSVEKKRLATHDNVWQPFFAVEAPLFVRRQSTTAVGQWLHEHLRVVAGSSFVTPAHNFFIGVTALPIVKTELESLPIQVQAAWRWNGGFVSGLSVDGGGLLGNALKALGSPF